MALITTFILKYCYIPASAYTYRFFSDFPGKQLCMEKVFFIRNNFYTWQMEDKYRDTHKLQRC